MTENIMKKIRRNDIFKNDDRKKLSQNCITDKIPLKTESEIDIFRQTKDKGIYC